MLRTKNEMCLWFSVHRHRMSKERKKERKKHNQSVFENTLFGHFTAEKYRTVWPQGQKKKTETCFELKSNKTHTMLRTTTSCHDGAKTNHSVSYKLLLWNIHLFSNNNWTACKIIFFLPTIRSRLSYKPRDIILIGRAIVVALQQEDKSSPCACLSPLSTLVFFYSLNTWLLG